MKKTLINTALASALLLSQYCLAQSQVQVPAGASDSSQLLEVQQRWAVANYQLQGDKKIHAFDDLIASIGDYLKTHPNDTRLWIWDGIVKSTMAGAKGGLGALSYAKDARKDLEHAMTLDDRALSGSAYTSLGTLYHKVPGWPIGFGSDKKARKLFKTALSINPSGIDPNYFYGEFLYDEGEYAEAQKHLLAAQAAAPRPDRPLADKGRQQEISELLTKVEKKLN